MQDSHKHALKKKIKEKVMAHSFLKHSENNCNYFNEKFLQTPALACFLSASYNVFP